MFNFKKGLYNEFGIASPIGFEETPMGGWFHKKLTSLDPASSIVVKGRSLNLIEEIFPDQSNLDPL